MCSSLLSQSLASFMNPIGVNRLLKYLEADGKGAVIHLWVWIAFATGGPFLAWTLHHLSRFLSVSALPVYSCASADPRAEQNVRPHRVDYHRASVRASSPASLGPE
jgi:hypothetical protein